MKHAVLFAAMVASPCIADTGQERFDFVKTFFADATVVSGPDIVDCKLSGGTDAKCFSITVKAEPKTYTPGPWCPTTINDTAEAGGIWLEGGEVHDVDGAFITKLPEFYDDQTWQLFDPETGKIRVTDTQESCEAAARPDVDEAYNNYCVQCELSYMPEDASLTYVIPLEPQHTVGTSSSAMSGAGIANNGVRLDGPAPVDAILSAHTLAPFDDCGGHVNTHVGYHYHAVTDCLNDSGASGGHAAHIGIALDGYDIFEHLLSDGTAPLDLDKCNGHETDAAGYHYHAGAAGSNEILACHHAETGCALDDPNQTCDATQKPSRP